jgi:hypothetical protein
LLKLNDALGIDTNAVAARAILQPMDETQ